MSGQDCVGLCFSLSNITQDSRKSAISCSIEHPRLCVVDCHPSDEEILKPEKVKNLCSPNQNFYKRQSLPTVEDYVTHRSPCMCLSYINDDVTPKESGEESACFLEPQRRTSSDNLGSPAAVRDIGTLLASTSGVCSSPAATQDIGTSPSDLTSKQGVACADDNSGYSVHGDDEETIPKRLADGPEQEDDLPATDRQTTQRHLPQQESTAAVAALVPREANLGEEFQHNTSLTQQRYISSTDTTGNAAICTDFENEINLLLRQKDEEVRRLEKEITDLRKKFARYVMRVREDVRSVLSTMTLTFLEALACRICQQLGLASVHIDHSLNVNFTYQASSLTSERVAELKVKIESILKDHLPEDIREGISWSDPVQCKDSETGDNNIHGMPSQEREESSERTHHVQHRYSVGQSDEETILIPHHSGDVKSTVWVRAITRLPDSRLILTDAFNMSLKVVSMASPSPAVIDCIPLSVKPFGVTVLGDRKTVAVTTEEVKAIFLLEIKSGGEPKRVDTQKQYRGVGPGPENSLVVSCGERLQINQEASVDIVSQKGEVLWTHAFSGHFALDYLTVSGDDVFVSDKVTNSVYRIRVRNKELIETLTHEAMKWPRQMAVGSAGSLIVACSDRECVLMKAMSGDWSVVLTGSENGVNTRPKASALAILEDHPSGISLVVAWGKFGDSALKLHSLRNMPNIP